MSKSVLYMSMSLDGFITSPDDAQSLLRAGVLDELEIHLRVAS
jgi:hypothetical protein